MNNIILKTSYMIMKTDRPITEHVSKLRGFISNIFSEYVIFHHHLNENKFLYTYPRIQYKIIDQEASILGIEEGATLIKKLAEINKLNLGDNVYNIEQKIFYDKNEIFGPTQRPIQYEFLIPWIALNQENHRKYKLLKNYKEKNKMLRSIIIGNIISMCKGFSYDIEQDIYAYIKIKEIEVKYKESKIGFIGEFKMNFKIPDHFGIGRGVSHGFGTIKFLHENKDRA